MRARFFWGPMGQGFKVNPKSEYLNPKQIQIFKIQMTKTYNYESLVEIV